MTDYLKLHADRQPDKTAVVFEGRTISWSQLWQQTEALSDYFVSELGVKDQQVVSLLLTNSIDFIIVYLAILHAGHITMPLDPAYKKMELDAIINQISPKIIITQKRYEDQISSHTMPTIMASDLLGHKGKPSELLRLPPKQQVASLTFTSGTSGKPKAVPNTHANHVWNIQVCSQVWDWTPKDSLLLTLPLSHMHGIVIGLSGALYHGNTLYLYQQSFDARQMLECLASGKVTMFTHSPYAYMQMLEHAGEYDLSPVRVCISGGAPLPPPVWQGFRDRFGVEIVETYGSTETGRIAGNRLGKRMVGSPGQVMPGVDLKLSEEHEVLVKSDGVFPGYWHNRAATEASLTSDGYWRTGDIAELKNGYIFLKGRVQEKIRRFAYSISPRDVEWAMQKNPEIKDIYVMGRQTGEPNDELIYFVVSALDDEEISAYCKQNLLFAWRPDRIIHLNEIPRTRSGKARIGELKEMVS